MVLFSVGGNSGLSSGGVVIIFTGVARELAILRFMKLLLYWTVFISSRGVVPVGGNPHCLTFSSCSPWLASCVFIAFMMAEGYEV